MDSVLVDQIFWSVCQFEVFITSLLALYSAFWLIILSCSLAFFLYLFVLKGFFKRGEEELQGSGYFPVSFQALILYALVEILGVIVIVPYHLFIRASRP